MGLRMQIVGGLSRVVRHLGTEKELPERILVVRPDHLGDLVLTFPALAELRRAFPAAEIQAIVAPSCTELLERSGFVDRVWERPATSDSRAHRALARRLRRQRIDVSLDFVVGDRHQMRPLMLRSRIPVRIGWRTRRAAWYTQVVESDLLRYEAESCLELVRTLTGVEAPPLAPEFWTRLGDRLFGASTPDPTRVVLAPFVDSLNRLKEWPHVRAFVEEFLREPALSTHRLAIVGVADDRARATELAALDPDRIENLVGHTTAIQLATTIRQAGLVVTMNSGPMNLALLSQTPTLVVNGPSSASRWLPRAAHFLHVGRTLDCNRRDCALCTLGDHFCMMDIDPGEVLTAVCGMLLDGVGSSTPIDGWPSDRSCRNLGAGQNVTLRSA